MWLTSRHHVRLATLRTLSPGAQKRCWSDQHIAKARKNLLIGKHTRVIYQGFTGRVATTNARDSIAYGTNIVGGVTPGKQGEHLGLPLLPNLRAAKEQLKPDATAIFVPGTGAAKAIEDAIEAEIPLIVAVAEHIPLHDMLRVMQMLATSNSSLVGANSPGIISPLHSCRIGFQPLPMYAPGNVGVVAKSGTLSYEAVASLTRAGLGQSLCIGTGGDIVSGTSLVDGFRVLEVDPDTEGIVVVGETGGNAEIALAEAVADARQGGFDKPVVALVAGQAAPRDRIMGHAGAFDGLQDYPARQKHEVLSSSGVEMVDHPEQFGMVMKRLLAQRAAGEPAKQAQGQVNFTGTPKLMSPRRPHAHLGNRLARNERRMFVLPADQSVKLLQDELPGMRIELDKDSEAERVGVSIDRVRMSVEVSQDDSARARPLPETISNALLNIHARTEAIELSVGVSTIPSKSSDSAPTYVLSGPYIRLDPSAFRTATRQSPLFATRDTSLENPLEVEAEKHGIAYVRLEGGASANIGTLVNGAGLAMNTVDCLAGIGGRCANFLDTGGKATSDTVKRSFELLLRDARVAVIFVNIFGGLTDCAMIAEGILLAFRTVEMRGVPVVVRLRGTNEKEGQRTIADSGLPLEAFDGFAEAAARVVELAGGKGTQV